MICHKCIIKNHFNPQCYEKHFYFRFSVLFTVLAYANIQVFPMVTTNGTFTLSFDANLY